MKNLKEATFLEIPYDDSTEALNVDPSSLINHPLQSTEELFHAHQFVETEVDQQADPALRKMCVVSLAIHVSLPNPLLFLSLGHWSGFCAQDDLYPSQSMIALDLHVSSANIKEFYCKGIASNGTNWNLTGRSDVLEDGKVQYTFIITYVARFPAQHFFAQLDESGTTLSGVWGSEDEKPYTFIFKRLSSEVMRFYPTPTQLAENKARAMWYFAISATVADVRRKMGSWDWLRQRWQTGQRYAELVIRRTVSPLTADEITDLARCQRTMTPEEARLYQIFRDLRQRSIPVHWFVTIFHMLPAFGSLTIARRREIYCDVCGEVNIQGSRIICVSCGMKTTVDLCSKEECLASEVGLDVRDDLTSPHLPSHDILKLRTAIHPYREYGQVYRTAQAALKSVRQRFADLPSSEGQGEVEEGKEAPTCVKCRERTSLPCWYCIECEGVSINLFARVTCQ